MDDSTQASKFIFEDAIQTPTSAKNKKLCRNIQPIFEPELMIFDSFRPTPLYLREPLLKDDIENTIKYLFL
jgi:hypothetical protein